jgi:transposase InsO family protein
MDARTRLAWVKLYEEVGDAGVVCRRCGISRPTLRKWRRRYQAEGEIGLQDRSRRPHHSPNRKVFAPEETLILTLRRQRRLGVKRLRIELLREYGLKLALDTVHKGLTRNGERYLKPRPLRRKRTRRYSRPVPGDRVQLDVCKVAPGVYQYTAIDDCSRFQVLGLFPRRTAANTLAFLEQVLDEMPFAIQRMQTDRGQEFFAYKVQEQLQAWHIKFRPPIRPRSPHLNGKVERAQRTALEEFWATADLKGSGLTDELAEWQTFYNWQRPHSALGGKAPIDRVCELLPQTPLTEQVWDAYDPSRETIRTQDYHWTLPLRDCNDDPRPYTPFDLDRS